MDIFGQHRKLLEDLHKRRDCSATAPSARFPVRPAARCRSERLTSTVTKPRWYLTIQESVHVFSASGNIESVCGLLMEWKGLIGSPIVTYRIAVAGSKLGL